jgi:hypothetical protein
MRNFLRLGYNLPAPKRRRFFLGLLPVMNSVGELVKETADLNERGLSADAFSAACRAFALTLSKATGITDPGLPDIKNFVDEYWEILKFMSVPAERHAPMETPILIREISMNPRRRYTPKEIVVHLVSQTVRTGRLPDGFGFTRGNLFEKKNDVVLVPVTLISGLLTFSVVHPTNANEEVPEKYWVSIGDFKMFISEFWGRMDLAERIRKLYLER